MAAGLVSMFINNIKIPFAVRYNHNMNLYSVAYKAVQMRWPE